jgi:predicted RNase H-like nuclease
MKNKLKIMRKIKVLLSVILFSTATAFAQQNSTDVNDSELKKFATVYKKVQEVSRESQNKMVEIVQNEGIEVQRYNIVNRYQEILASIQSNPDLQTKLQEYLQE